MPPLTLSTRSHTPPAAPTSLRSTLDKVTQDAIRALGLVYDLREQDPTDHRLTAVQSLLEGLLFSIETADL